MTDFRSQRTFRIWDYSVSHSQLLVRSAHDQSDECTDNVDLIFSGVFYIALADIFRGLAVRSPSEAELDDIEERSGVAEDATHRYYVLTSGGREYVVGAASLRIDTNRVPPWQTVLDFPRKPSDLVPKLGLGTPLAEPPPQ